MPFVVGLTGGIGSGKTTVAKIFERAGAQVIDTDEIARRLTSAGQPAVARIVQLLGTDVVAADGSLDRAKVRETVFRDAAARRSLEAVLHPLIGDEVRKRAVSCSGPYVMVIVPLLVETGAYADLFDRIVVVDCPEELQVERVTRRNGLSPEEVRAIMRVQASRSERLARADHVIRNEGTPQALLPQVEALHRFFLAAASSR